MHELPSQTGTATPRSQPTVAALIAAARRLFARHGYEGASVRRITAEAGANIGAIGYHFESKLALYERVLVDALEPLLDEVDAVTSAPGTPMEHIEAVTRVYFDYYLSDDSDFPRLMLQELVVAERRVEASMEALGRVHETLAGLVEAGQRDGEIRPGDPRILALSIVSQPIHFGLTSRALEESTGLDLHQARAREQTVAHALEFVRAGLARREVFENPTS